MDTLVKSIVVASAVFGMASMVATSVHATDQQTCVNGNVRSNLSVSWQDSGHVSVGTIGNKPLCSDTTIFFSSYTMPDEYNGKPFNNNPTASPQTIFDTTSVVLKKDATQAESLAIDLPATCKNIQVDVYYAPEIKTVTARGHGNQYITGKILTKTDETCAPVTTEQPPVEQPPAPIPEAETPSTPAPEVTVAPVIPKNLELPHTGNDDIKTLVIASFVTAATYTAAYVSTKQR